MPPLILPTMDRFLVLSLLEDLQFPPPPEDPLFPGESKKGKQTRYDELFVSSPTGLGGGSEVAGLNNSLASSSSSAAATSGIDEGLLTAGEQTDVAEESCERQLARVRAVAHLPALARKMGARWTFAELVPYLMRCCEEDCEALSFAVAKVLPSLLGLCTVASTKPPPKAVGNGMSHLFTATSSESGGLSSDKRDLTTGDAVDTADAKRFTFSARSQKSLEASLSVSGELIAETISNTVYYEELPPSPLPANGGQPPNPNAFVNSPSQHVITPDALAPVLVALSSVSSQLVRRFVADVTIPTVCFGVPFSMHYPLFSISSSGADWAKRGGGTDGGGIGGEDSGGGGGGDGDSSGGAYSSLGAGKASVPMPANEINGPMGDGTDGFDMFARFMRISAEERVAMQRLGLFSGGAGSNALEANADDVFFYRLLKVLARPSESKRSQVEGKEAGFSSENNVERETLLANIIKEWETHRARRVAEGNSYDATPPSDPFSHSQRRGQLRAAIRGALARQEKIFLPHSHTYVSTEEQQQQTEGKAVDRRYGAGGSSSSSSSSGVGLFNAVLRHLLLGGSGTTRTSIISGAGESFGMRGGGGSSSASPWPLHLSTAVRLIANLVRLLTSCAVFNVQSLCLALGKMSASSSTIPTADSSSSDSSSSSSPPSVFPNDTSSAPYTPFEERMLLVSLIQETVSLDDVVLPAINMVSTVLLDDRRGGARSQGLGNENDGGEEGEEDISLATEDVYAKQPALARFLAAGSSSSSKLSSNDSALDFIVDNPFVFAGRSSSDSSLFRARKRLRYPISKEAIDAFLETLLPALAIKSPASSKAVEQLLLSVAGRRHIDKIGYCCVPRLEFLISFANSSAASHDTATGQVSGSKGPSMILSAVRSSLLSASDVGGILFDLMAMPIPTASAALPPPPSPSVGVGMMGRGLREDDAEYLLYGSAMGTVALDDLERRYEEHRRLMISLTRRGSGGGAGPTEDDRNHAREVGEVVGALGGLLLGAGGGGGSVSRQPSMMPAHERVVGSSGATTGGGQSSGAPTSGSREPKTMFSIVASVRTSRSALEQVRKSLDSSTEGGQGPPSSSSSSTSCKERLQLLRSRSFGGHYYKTVALCCQAFCIVAKQCSYLSSFSIVLACGGGVGVDDSSGTVRGGSELQSVRASVANLTSLLFAASVAIIGPVPYYLSWRSRYSGAVWMPSVASVVAMLTDRLACFSTCIVPALSGSAVSSPSSVGMKSKIGTTTLTDTHPSLVLLRDALILWQNGGGVGAAKGGPLSGSEHYPTPTTADSVASITTLLSRLCASTAVLPLKVFIPSDDYAELSTHFATCVWPLVKRAQMAFLSASRDLVFEELEEEVRVAALERLLVTPRPSPYSMNQQHYCDPFSGPVATSVMTMTAIVSPLAELRATIEEAGEERWRHDSHTRLRSSIHYTRRIPSLLPSVEATDDEKKSVAPATSSLTIVTPFAAAAEILETTRLALGRGDGTGTSGIVVVGGAVANAPANVSERTRAAVPLGITQLLAESWRCGLSISSFFATEAATPSYPSASSSSVRSPIALYPFVGSLIGFLSPATTGKLLGSTAGGGNATALPSALRGLAMSISRQNEEDLRYIHFSLTEKSRVGMAMLATEYTGFRDACSRVLGSLASDNGPLVQIGIVNAMLRLLASSPTANTIMGADGDAALLTNGSHDNDQTRQGYRQPSMLDRAEMEVFVSETCARLVRSEVWRVRETFAPTLAKAIAAYVAPAVLLGVEALEGIVERSRQRRQQVDAGGHSSTSTAGSGGAPLIGSGSGEWTPTEARYYEKVFADVLGLSAPSSGGDGEERYKGKPTKTAAVVAEGGTSQALLLANYHFATTELLPMFVSLMFDKTKAVRDAATDAAARLAFTLRQASAAFDGWQRQHATARSASISMLTLAAEERSLAHVEQFINNDLFTSGIVESSSASQHSYLMRVQLLTVAVTMGVDKASILIPLLARFAKDQIVNVRMAVAKAIAALVKRQRSVEGTNAVTREAALRIMRMAGGGAGANETISQTTAAVPSPLASSGIRRGLLSISAPTKSQLVVGVGSTSSDGSNTNTVANGAMAREVQVSNENSFFAPLPPQRSTLTDTAEREISNSPHPSLLTEELCFYYHFTKDEVEELLCATMLRPLLEDSSQDVRDLASRAFTACY